MVIQLSNMIGKYEFLGDCLVCSIANQTNEIECLIFYSETEKMFKAKNVNSNKIFYFKLNKDIETILKEDSKDIQHYMGIDYDEVVTKLDIFIYGKFITEIK